MLNTIKQWTKKVTGIEKIEQEKAALLAEKEAAEAEAQRARKEEELAKLSPKDRATKQKEPWVGVLDTHVNPDNVRNGFFELDWNEYFILQLRSAGYQGETDEAIVDQWFQDLCRNVGEEAGVNMDRRGSGYINVNNIGNGRSEIS